MTTALGYTGPREALDVYVREGKPPPQLYQWRTECRLCSGPLSEVLRLPDQPLANEYPDGVAVSLGIPQDTFPVVIAQCGACGHVQLQTVINPLRLFSEYSYTSGIAASFRKHIGELAKSLYAAGHRTIVDIGSNDGTLLQACRELGMVGVGVDPARNLAAEASQRGNLTIPGFFNVDTARQLRELFGKAPDVVTGLNVFAHADGLGEMADGIRELIGDTGVFVMEVAYLRDVLDKNECGTLYHEHVSTHHVAPLVKFWRAHGLEVHDVERIPAQGGSIRVVVTADPGRERMGHGSVNRGLIALLDDERVVLPPLLANWQSRVTSEIERTRHELRPYLAQGPIAIFGAAARLTPYVYTLGLGKGDVSCVFDDEPRKIGKFTPGNFWPIVDSRELVGRNPRAILVASWNYAQDIMKRFPEYHGAWLVPRPEFRKYAYVRSTLEDGLVSL